jgi:predicted nucleic acid-binding protein
VNDDPGRGAFVLDASVAAKLFFQEEGALEAEAWLESGLAIVAPDFLAMEMASIAAKKLRAGDADPETATAAVREVLTMADEVVPAILHLRRAAEIAFRHAISVYDANYLALAEARGCFVVTADAKLVARAQAEGLGDLVRRL